MVRRGMGSSQAGLRKRQRSDEVADDLRVKRERLRIGRRVRGNERKQSEPAREVTSPPVRTGDQTREPIIIRHGGKEIEV